jgi:hypothetical protein
MSATAPEEDGIHQAINFYIDGLREGSIETLKEGFHPEATMCGYFGETLMVTPIQGLYDFVSSNPAPAKTGEPYSASVAVFEVAGSIASAKVIEQSYQGHNFTCFFNLLKIDGRWWIVSKVFNVDS